MDLSYGLGREVEGAVHCQEPQSNHDKRGVRWRYAAEVELVPEVEYSLHGLEVGLEEEHSSSHWGVLARKLDCRVRYHWVGGIFDQKVVGLEEAHSVLVRMPDQS